MATRSSTMQAGTGSTVISTRSAAGLGVAILALGMLAGLLIGRAGTQQAERTVPANTRAVISKGARVTGLQDYGVRHASEFASASLFSPEALRQYVPPAASVAETIEALRQYVPLTGTGSVADTIEALRQYVPLTGTGSVADTIEALRAG